MAATPTRSASGTQGQDPRLSTLRGMPKPAAGGHPAPQGGQLKGGQLSAGRFQNSRHLETKQLQWQSGASAVRPSPEPRSLTQPVGPAERFQEGSKLSQPALQKETLPKPYEPGFSSALQICLFLGPGSWLGPDQGAGDPHVETVPSSDLSVCIRVLELPRKGPHPGPPKPQRFTPL